MKPGYPPTLNKLIARIVVTVGMVLTAASAATAAAVHPMLQYSIGPVKVGPGHPRVHLCRTPRFDKAIPGALRFQFPMPPDNERQEETVAETAADMLEILADNLTRNGHYWVNFAARDVISACSARHADWRNVVYRRDHNDEWIRVTGRIHKALRKQLKALQTLNNLDDLNNKISLLLTLAQAENHVPRTSRGTVLFIEAHALSKSAGVSRELQNRAAHSLLMQHFKVTNDMAAADALLQEYGLWLHEQGFPEDQYEYIYSPPPVYPRTAVVQRIEGWVVLNFDVERDGRVSNIVVEESSPPGVFDRAAIESASQFRYVPKFENGKAVRQMGVQNRITFELRD